MHKFFAKTQFIGKNVIYLPQCHSTNTEMQTFLKKNILKEGTVVMADFQIKGRGQLNGRWISQKWGLTRRSLKYFSPFDLPIDRLIVHVL